MFYCSAPKNALLGSRARVRMLVLVPYCVRVYTVRCPLVHLHLCVCVCVCFAACIFSSILHCNGSIAQKVGNCDFAMLRLFHSIINKTFCAHVFHGESSMPSKTANVFSAENRLHRLVGRHFNQRKKAMMRLIHIFGRSTRADEWNWTIQRIGWLDVDNPTKPFSTASAQLYDK